jgi:hypothetical protein
MPSLGKAFLSQKAAVYQNGTSVTDFVLGLTRASVSKSIETTFSCS